MRANAVHIIVLLWMLANPFSNFAQQRADNFSFSNQTIELLPTSSFKSQYVIGIADMNNDGLDDIVRLSSGQNMEIQYQNTGAAFQNLRLGSIGNQEQLTLCIADVDRDSFNDILIGGDGDQVKLLYSRNEGTEYDQTLLPFSSFFLQGSNFADIDNDGWIDVFVCNDTATSRVWMNDQNGQLNYSSTAVDMDLFSPSKMNGGNYSSVWTDFDNDGDLDLYLSKCSKLATGPTDPRLINQLFVNDGNNNYREAANNFGLADNHQSWTADFQDIDNDGDMDCFLVNHMDRCRLFENDGTGQYQDITFSAGIDIRENMLHGTMRDFDNDGYVDILVAGSTGYKFYTNKGNRTFKEITGVFDDYTMGIFTTGDLNNDGYLDVYAGSDDIVYNDVLWINDRNRNNYFSLHLEGRQSNRNAIGARVEIHGPWGVQVREVRAGESYGVMNSPTLYFGLGIYTQIDRMVIRWPKGLEEVYTNISANQKMIAIEDECLYPGKNIASSGEVTICAGETLTLTAPLGIGYRWSSGQSSRAIEVDSSGEYWVIVTGRFGCESRSFTLKVTVDPDETPVIEVVGEATYCFGGGSPTTLAVADAQSYLWSNGQTNQTIVPTSSGEYTVTVQGLCGEFTSQPVTINLVDIPLRPTATGDTIPQPGVVTLTASGNQLNWYDDQNRWVGSGPVFTTTITETTTFRVRDSQEGFGITCEGPPAFVNAVIDPLTAIRNLQLSGKARVFPNPTADQLYLELLDWQATSGQLRIVDLQGREHYAQQIAAATAQTLPIPTAALPQGMYILLLVDQEETYSTRFIKR
ncbi:MAG: FG-GAP-like repeat-containing protein [Bacteroidota bacterium]